jgi:hypothetical protein
MSDVDDNGNNRRKKFEQMAEKPFFIFSRPYLDFIDKSRIYSLVYFVMAAVNLILPFVILYKVIDSGFFRLGANFVFAFIFSWIVIVFACWIGFQLWWNRRKRIVNIGTSEFSATLIFSEILQTFGEWLGTLTGIIGFGAGLLASIFLGDDVNYLFRAIGMGYLGFGPVIVIIGPVIGFFIIILFRFLAEQFRLLASLVNNTKEIADNIKNSAKG